METAIRVKVSHQAGLGHWVRQRHLAHALHKAGSRVTLFPDHYGHLGQIPPGVNLEPVAGNKEFLDKLSSHADLAILDIHETTPEFISQVRASADYIVGFEDLGAGRNHLNCLIDCNLPADASKELDDSVTPLFGWQYSLLAPEYGNVGKASRKFSEGIQSILVTMGGTDPNNLTGSVAGLLIEGFPEIKTTVVTGPGFKVNTGLEQLFQNPQITHRFQPESLAPLLLDHDAVICSGGVTLHEALSTGTPSFVVPQVEHQEILTARIQERGAARLVGSPGKVDDEMLLEVIKTSPETLHGMSLNGRELIDGRGLERITGFLMKQITSE